MSTGAGFEAAVAGAAKDVKAEQKRDWQELPTGGRIPEAGSGAAYQTGDWRTQRPVIDFDQCIQCFFCWVYCPDGSIRTQNKKVIGVDYYHCKGCGICAEECPKKCIAMIDEETVQKNGSGS